MLTNEEHMEQINLVEESMRTVENGAVMLNMAICKLQPVLIILIVMGPSLSLQDWSKMSTM